MLPRRPAVLLLSTGAVKPTDVDFGLPHLVSLGGYLEARLAVRAVILDAGYEGDLASLGRTLSELGPFIAFGISCYSSYDARKALRIASFLKTYWPRVPRIAGGYHASALPEALLAEGRFDAVVVGEGERPFARIVEAILGGQPVPRGVLAAEPVEDLDDLPETRWDLLDRYWPKAESLGRKLQLYLSRGCPHRCTFCMERAKSGGYHWRAFSPERALDELSRLAARVNLERWIVNLADPLFGAAPAWRRQVLEGILKRKLSPRVFWTLTRAETLSDDDVALLARARFAIGVGLESGDPEMLRRMQKTRSPETYLEAILRLADRARRHGLPFATNLILGHPGETEESLAQTLAFAKRLFLSESTSRGWLSVDPFRLYPGSLVHQEQAAYALEYGTRFYHPEWWNDAEEQGFRAEHLDPSASLDYAARVRHLHDAYLPLVSELARRFQGRGDEADGIFTRSVGEQVRLLAPERRDALLAQAERLKTNAPRALPALPPAPLPEEPGRSPSRAIRQATLACLRLPNPVLRALVAVRPEAFLKRPAIEALISDGPGFTLARRARALAALDLKEGESVLCLGAEDGYDAAVLARLVGPEGRVFVAAPSRLKALALRLKLRGRPQVQVAYAEPTTAAPIKERFDACWLTHALPRFPTELSQRLSAGGRALLPLGPRFGDQDLVLVVKAGDTLKQRPLERVVTPPARGLAGWIR